MTGSAGDPDSVQAFAYSHDAIGNLKTRNDAKAGLNETFNYDPLNRLLSVQVGTTLTKTFTYSPVGNLLTKSDLGAYAYPTPGPGVARPHAVTSISGPVLNTTFRHLKELPLPSRGMISSHTLWST